MFPPIPEGSRIGPVRQRLARRFALMTRLLQDYDIVRFGACELRLATQELLCGGKSCEIEPRALAVLIYLIENSDRVIPKEELLEKIWKTIHVTDGVVARAVMKLRRALDDNDLPSKYLKTVHRVGYRFISELEIESRSEAASLAPPQRRIELALLPFRNLAGGTRFDWIELGLMSIAHRTVVAAGLKVAPIAQVLMTGLSGEPMPHQARVASLQAALGVRSLLWVEVGRQQSRFILDWRLLPDDAARPPRPIESRDLVGATLSLANQLGERMLNRPGVARSPAFNLGDPFLDEAYGRAMQAYHSGRLQQAIGLLRVCLNVAPARLPIEIDLFVMLADAYDEAAIACGEALLAHSAATGNAALEALVLERLAQVAQYFERFERAEAYCARCAQLLSENALPETEARLLLTQVALARRRRDHARARELATTVLANARESGNALVETQALRQLGLIEAGAGRASQALTHFEGASELAAQHGFDPLLCMVLASQCELQALMGRLTAARQLLLRAQPLGEKAGTPQIRLKLSTLDFGLALLAGEAGAVRRALAQLERPLAAGPLRFTVIQKCCKAVLELLVGHLDDGRRLLEEAQRLLPNTRLAIPPIAVFVAPQLKLRALDACEQTLQVFEERLADGSDPALWSLAHGCRAQLAHARGDVALARKEAELALALAPDPRAGVLVGIPPIALDAIWLAAEEGDAASVSSLVADLESWLDESARGVATKARYCYALGRFDEALALQRRYRDMIGSETHDFCIDLLPGYEQAARRGKGGTLPRVRTLPATP